VNKRCLVLSSFWFPIGIENLEDSLTKLSNQGVSEKIVFIAKTFVIGEIEMGTIVSYQRFTFNEWVKRGIREGKSVIHTKYLAFEVPEVIMKTCDHPYIQKLPLKAQHLFARDGYKCWYCGSESDLTMDHIIPQVRGGKSTWKNLITACKSCNNQKGDMDTNRFCQMKNCAIPKPINVGSFPFLKELGKRYPESWKKWLNFV